MIIALQLTANKGGGRKQACCIVLCELFNTTLEPHVTSIGAFIHFTIEVLTAKGTIGLLPEWAYWHTTPQLSYLPLHRSPSYFSIIILQHLCFSAYSIAHLLHSGSDFYVSHTHSYSSSSCWPRKVPLLTCSHSFALASPLLRWKQAQNYIFNYRRYLQARYYAPCRAGILVQW